MGKNSNQRDIYAEITGKIISILEGLEPGGWEAPFACLAAQGLPFNPITGQQYHGVNIPALWVAQQEKEFASNYWATFNQWKDQGVCVRKGQRASRIIFYKTLVKSDENDNGEVAEQVSIPMLRCYNVFNADQVEGYEHAVPEQNKTDSVNRIEAVETFCLRTGADIRCGGTAAYYHRSEDFINIPDSIAFRDTTTANATDNYYATLLHELTHWTGAPHRLDRDKARNQSERHKYAFEELIAELGAAFLCAQLGITQTPREDHAHYLMSWLQALRNDNKYIFQASAAAARACEYLNVFQES